MPDVIPAPAPVRLPIIGSTDSFPVRHIWCVGRNYAEHAKEMGGDTREPPFFFAKFAEAIVPCAYGASASLPYPTLTRNLHHEVELVVAIGRGGMAIPAATALEHVFGYAVGLDMTRRDVQFALRDKGRPWDLGKNFDAAAPCGPIHPAAATGHPGAWGISLAVNGTPRQQGKLSDLIWSVAEVIAHLSAATSLAAGDLIYTGTPAGVGPVVAGDVMAAQIDGLGAITVSVA